MATTRKVPGSALRFSGDVKFGQFASKAAGEGEPQELEPVDCDLTLLSGEPIDHPYWGKCMFDLAGAKTHKDTYALDYNHDPDQVIGKFAAPVAGDGGAYVAKASVIPFAADDRASEIIHRQAAGTPYESSIFFDPGTAKVECLDDDEVGQVNGQQVQGPLTIFRQFDVRGGALCPAGRDKFAHAEFCESEFSLSVTGNPRISHMSAIPAAPIAAAAVAAAPTAPAQPEGTAAGQLAATAASTPAAVAAPQELRAAEAKKFTEAFGPEQGAKYFAAGETIESAAGKFAVELRKEVEALKTRMAGVGLAGASLVNGQLVAGEIAPVSSEIPGAEKTLTPEQARYGKNVGAFMAACALPKK